MIPVHFYDGKSSFRHASTLRLSTGRFYLAGAWGLREAGLSEVSISEPMGSAPRTLRFVDGAYCEITDQRAFAAMLAAAGHRESLSVRLHQRMDIVLVSLAAVVALVAAFSLWLLPAAADAIAPRLPASFATLVSEATLANLDDHILRPSGLSPQREVELRRRMADFAHMVGLPHYALHFRAAPPGLPPNAFALPSGDIVVFDSLINALSDDEAIAVFAHELGHVAHYDGLRMLIRGTVVSTAAAVYLGDLSSAVAALSAAALQANYSQDFESQADLYAAAALKRSGRSPMLLATALEKLTAVAGAKHKGGAREPDSFVRIFSSHPSVAKRIAALKAVPD